MRQNERPIVYGSYKFIETENDLKPVIEWVHNSAAACANRISANKYDVQIIVKTKEDYIAMAGVDDELRGLEMLNRLAERYGTVGWKLYAYDAIKPDDINKLVEGVCPEPET